MAFRYNTIIYFCLLAFAISCKEELPKTTPQVRILIPPKPFDIPDINVLHSDFLNWDSIPFRYNRQLINTWNYRYNTEIEFVSISSNPDTIKLTFDRMRYKTENPYLCGSPQAEVRINKFSKTKYQASGATKDAIIFHQFSNDSAEVSFDIIQTTNYRLPDNTILKARIKGKFRVPRLYTYDLY